LRVLELKAFTDGACSGNPGPGGWGVVLQAINSGDIVKERELSGGAGETTNNQMELMAAISALETLERASRITVVTDSSYVKDGVSAWMQGRPVTTSIGSGSRGMQDTPKMNVLMPWRAWAWNLISRNNRL